MNVQCAICDKVEDIDGNSLLAKRLRNRRITSYLCEPCYERISIKTQERHDTGNFHLYSSISKKKNNK